MAWTTLEHDIIYKKLHGNPDKKLCLQLETLEGIANLREVVLAQYDDLLDSNSLSPFFQLYETSFKQQLKIRNFLIHNKNTALGKSQRQQEFEAIILWVSTIDVKNDHNQVRTVLGSHYENSGQWFRRFYND